jgi:hypothetical protein
MCLFVFVEFVYVQFGKHDLNFRPEEIVPKLDFKSEEAEFNTQCCFDPKKNS